MNRYFRCSSNTNSPCQLLADLMRFELEMTELLDVPKLPASETAIC